MARNSKLGMAFVTFEDINHARTVMEDHDRNFIERCLALKKRAGESKLAMKPHRWNVWFATRPDDIIWENLSNRHWQTLKKFMANLLIWESFRSTHESRGFKGLAVPHSGMIPFTED